MDLYQVGVGFAIVVSLLAFIVYLVWLHRRGLEAGADDEADFWLMVFYDELLED